jgi:hypothetical protein
MHIMESVHQFDGAGHKDLSVVRYLPLMKIGCRLFGGQDIFSMSSRGRNKLLGGCNENESLDDEQDGFPMMEKRQVSWKWVRPSIPIGPSALSLKSTVSFVDEKLVLWSKTFVVHEASIGNIEVFLDSDPLGRLMEAMSTVPWDERWFSGEWTDEITPDMVSVSEFSIKNYLQPIPGVWFGSSTGNLSTSSSDLRSVTARFSGITIRMPHPTYSFSSCGLADVLFTVSSATVIVTSQLPSSFLTGTITCDGGCSKCFPNDESDFSSRGDQSLVDEPSTQFRMQISLADFAMKVMPMPHLETELRDKKENFLIAPTKITSMLSLKHTEGANQTALVSVLVQRLESNIVLERALSAACTINYHLNGILRHSQPHESSIVNQTSQTEQGEPTNNETVSVVCVHVSRIALNLASIGVNRSGDLLNLSRLTLSGIEFGSETTCTVADERKMTLSVHKGVVGSFSLQIFSTSNDVIDVVTIDTESNEVGSSVMFRASSSSCQPSGTSAQTLVIDVASPVIISLDLDAIKALDIAIGTFSAPVYFYSRGRARQPIFESSTQPTMLALLSLIFEVMSSINSEDNTKSHTLGTNVMMDIFTRILLNKVLVQIPNTAAAKSDAKFLLAFDDIDVIVGHSGSISDLRSSILQHDCGRGDKWQALIGRIKRPDTFYAIKSKQSLVSIDDGPYNLVPSFSIDWSSDTGEEKVKDLIDTSLTVGSLMSYLGMKLYFMIPHASPKSKAATSMKELHNMVGHYHSKILRLLCNTDKTIDLLRLCVFAKERERIGMMALGKS